jgi:hypothetical protein
MVAGTEAVSMTTRASQLVAEALVKGHDREIIVQRARSMGLSRGLTDVLVAACPCASPSPQHAPARVDRVLATNRASS